MKKKEKIKNPRRMYRGVVGFSKLMSPVLKMFYYISATMVLLCGIIALIIVVVNVPTEDMLLPPLMSVHGTDYYSITIGNGIRIDTAYEAVSLGDIKTVIYAELLMAAAFFCMAAPISLFTSRLLKNISSGAEYDLKNARYMIYIALSVMVGYTFVQTAARFYNYLLVKTFVENADTIHFAMGFDPEGVIIGLMIVLFAYIYGHSCEKILLEGAKNASETAVVEHEM